MGFNIAVGMWGFNIAIGMWGFNIAVNTFYLQLYGIRDSKEMKPVAATS